MIRAWTRPTHKHAFALAALASGISSTLFQDAALLAAPLKAINKDKGLNLSDLKSYGRNRKMSSVSDFQDLVPSDWAYQALLDLSDRYGCIGGSHSIILHSNQPITRLQAAGLINSCLTRISISTDNLRGLRLEFKNELIILKGRADAISTELAVVEATQFSTTTKLNGETTIGLGAYGYGGSAKNGNQGPGLKPGQQLLSATTLNYEAKLNFDTSFSGSDLLRTRLRDGNYRGSAFGGSQYQSTRLVQAFGSTAGADILEVDRLYYQFPIGKEFKAIFAARARNTEMLALVPSVYESNLLDLYTGTFGVPGVYTREVGEGFALNWTQSKVKSRRRFAAGVNYISRFSSSGDPGKGGLFTAYGAGNLLAQAGLISPKWAIVGGYLYGQCGNSIRDSTQFTNRQSSTPCSSLRPGAATNNVAVNAYWQPHSSGWMPSVSAGWGHGFFNNSYDIEGIHQSKAFQSWMIGFQWNNLFANGNAGGFAVGQAPYTTKLFSENTATDSNYAWEWWYRWQITNSIAITPGVIYLSRPAGQNTPPGKTFDALGATIGARYRF